MKSRLTGRLFALGLFALTVATVLFYPSKPTTGTVLVRQGQDPGALIDDGQVIARPKVEVVFVLDTTGSMSGLIEAAKEKIWSIATTMASARPAPEIRMGLVAYRDRGDAYVTRVTDLSDDLDSMYANLVDFRADGGGDGPESVNQALYDAVHGISWSQDPDSYKVIFLVGDAPPHMDYQDDVKYPETLAAALDKDIVVNTIQCGHNDQTTRQWQRMARLSHGRYFAVEQAGSAVAIATPFDADIAKLSAALDETRLYYGSEVQKEKMLRKLKAAEKVHAMASVEARARRATFNASAAGKKNLLGEGELVEDIASGRVELDAIAPEALPATMQAMSPEEQKDLVARQAETRRELQAQIGELAKKRDDFLSERVAETEGVEDSLDYKIYDAVREQAEEKGIRYEDGPEF